MPANKRITILKSEHLDLAKRSENLARAILGLNSLGIQNSDWIITICFYSVTHYIYSDIPIQKTVDGYSQMEHKIVKHYSSKKIIYKIYSWLKNKSFVARYNPKLANRYSNITAGVAIRKVEEIKKELKIR